MANDEHLAILKQGVEAWNRWRKRTEEHPSRSDAILENADLSGANLIDANLVGANLENTKLANANLSHANLENANLSRADLSYARLSRAKVGRADLSGASLHGAVLIGTLLHRADLSGADLTIAHLYGANLSGVNLYSADLNGANLGGANLWKADLSGANLGGANFSGGVLHGANLKNAVFKFTKFANCDLSEVAGLDLVRHIGPSTIGIDTIYASKGKIPESFLRGCGVPENFIRYIPSFVDSEEGIQFYSCFISYSGTDEDFAKRLHGKMRDAHLRVWFAPEDVQGGKKLHEQIEMAIRVYDKLLIVLSEASLQSEWVMDELRKGFKAERDTGKRKLFPVRLVSYETLKRWKCRDSLSGKDLAEEVRQYFIPDFSNWKDHDQFKAAFDRVLKDLRADSNAV